jgi:uncharacterized protein YoxC
MQNLDNQTIQLAVVAITALVLLVQTIVLVAIYLALSKATKSLREEVEDLRSSVMPVVDDSRELIKNTREFFSRVAPKVEATVDDLSEMAHGMRERTADVEFAAKEIVERVRQQTIRLDAMATGTLDAVDRASSFVAEVVSKPVRQLSGLLAAAKAIVESLLASEQAPRQTRSRDDEDMFL